MNLLTLLLVLAALASVLVVVQPQFYKMPPTGDRLVSTRAFLPPDARQQPDFGLYTYVLFRRHQTESEIKSRYREALREFLNLEDIKEFPIKTPAERSRLNVTGIPVWQRGLDKFVLVHKAEDINAVLARLLDKEYRYADAELVLRVIPEADGEGPFLLSAHEPLLRKDPRRPERYMVQKLSWVPPRLVGLWLREFLAAVEKEQTWDPRSIPALVLKLRTSIAVAAEAFKGAEQAAKDFTESRIIQ
jgi:hypothetical protein